MSNRGIFAGVAAENWRSYTPQWRSATFPLGAAVTTQPDIGNGTATGRYLRFPSGLCVAQLAFVWGTTTTFGTAADFYEWSLPVPAAVRLGTDWPIATGFVTQGTAASPNLTQSIFGTLADPASSSLKGIGAQSDEDNWLQGFCQWSTAMGVSGDANSPAFTSGATSVTVTHNLGAVGTSYIPAIYDISVLPTNSPSTNPKAVYVSNITATQFNINVGASSTTTPLTYAWKIKAEPGTTMPILIGPSAPWAWGATLSGSQWTAPTAGGSISFLCIYEARR